MTTATIDPPTTSKKGAAALPPSSDESSYVGNLVSRVPDMSRFQKLAALLVMLGPETSSSVFKLMGEDEVGFIAEEMSRLSLLNAREQREVLSEFSSLAVHASTAVCGSVELARSTLEKSVGMFKAADILGRISPTPTAPGAIQRIVEMEPRQLFNLIKQEQNQTIALLISYLSPDSASRILSMLDTEKRAIVIERLATLSPTSSEVMESVVEVVLARAGNTPPVAVSRSGGIKPAADILNSMDKSLSKSLLSVLEEKNSELSQAIKQKMFTFEDLVALEASDIQKILRDVDMNRLAIALKTASDRLRALLLSCLSKRAAEAVEEELEFAGPVKLADVEEAQSQIIAIVRQMEANEEIDLSSLRGNGSGSIR